MRRFRFGPFSVKFEHVIICPGSGQRPENALGLDGATALTKAACPACGRTYRVRPTGQIRAHRRVA